MVVGKRDERELGVANDGNLSYNFILISKGTIKINK